MCQAGSLWMAGFVGAFLAIVVVAVLREIEARKPPE